MRTLFQLLGGVAVAGAVAAGSTAFTAGAGLSLTGTAVGPAVLGGQATQKVEGADATDIRYTLGTDKSKIEKIEIDLVDNSSSPAALTTSDVTVTLDITGSDGTADTTAVSCTETLTPGTWECVDGVNYWSHITGATFTVLPV